MTQQVNIGIAGGTGGMGRWFEKYFTAAGHRVLIAGRTTELKYLDLVEQCQVVALSTPVEPALRIAAEIGPAMSPEQLLLDFCSQKKAIVEKMAGAAAADVIGTHPMFAPNTPFLAGQNVILCPARDRHGWGAWLESMFVRDGAVVTSMDPAEHDKKMAVTQSLTHFLTLSFARTLQKLDIKPEEAFTFATPIFRFNIDLVGRMFAQDIDLYADLVGNNPHTREVLKVFAAAGRECHQAFFPESSDSGEGPTAFLNDILGYFGRDFCEQALRETSRALRTMYENTPEEDPE
ncbi:MAG: prephenate dehydrogenase/arogenate dehydrogenase family protein [Desulfosudaceae bacterium]